jgi:(E)-4-hydroxy-3-methyl-but-2-enyl pyrophosphate reductase
MRKVVLARTAGFCYGVQRAVDIVMEARSRRYGRLTSLGPIVHNNQVAAKLSAEGVEAAADLGEISDGAVILSAHGVSPATADQARKQGLEIVDVTCPFVTRVHRTAQALLDQGYQLLLLGDPEHSEVKGIVGAVGGRVEVIRGLADLADIKLGRKVGIVTQTTQKPDMFASVVAEVSKSVFDVRAFNTICNATDELQEAAVDLARQVDAVIVVGGRQSANTARLREICEAEGVPAYHVETADEILDEWLDGRETIGLTAGASTPDWLIEEVAKRLNDGVLPDDFVIQHPDERTMSKFFGATNNVGGKELARRAS